MNIETNCKKGRGGRPPASEVEERRLHLIKVATDLFLSKGYEAASLEFIAKAAGASKTTIYRNFGDKVGLFRVVLRQFIEPVWPCLADIPTENRSPEEVLTAYGDLLISEFAMNQDCLSMIRLIYREAPNVPEVAHIFSELEEIPKTVVASYLDRATKAGLLAVENCELVANQFLELVWGRLGRHLIIGTVSKLEDSDRRRVVDAAVALFLNGTLPEGVRRGVIAKR